MPDLVVKADWFKLNMNKGYIYLGLTTLFFGSFEVVSKLIEGIDAAQLNFLRFFVGGLALLPFALKEIRKNYIRFSKRDILYLIVLGILLVPISMVLLQISVQKTSASLATFAFSSNPIFIALFAYLILGEKPNKYVILSIVFGVIGLYFIANPFNSFYGIYVLYPVIAAILFSAYTVLMRRVTAKLGNLVSTALVICFGVVILGVFLLIRGVSLFKGIDSGNILLLLYLGLSCSGIAYVFYYKGMELTSTNVGSIVFFIKPILGTVFAVLILSERLTGSFIIGAIFIIFGSIVMIYGKERSHLKKAALNSSAGVVINRDTY